MEQKHNLQKLFLQQFTKELITNSRQNNISITPIAKEKPDENMVMRDFTPSLFQIGHPIVREKHLPIVPFTKPILAEKTKQPRVQEMTASPKPNAKLNVFPRPKGGIPLTQPAPGKPNMGKLNTVVADPRVESIECPGPNKNILVKKDGTIQRTMIILTEAEIKNIIKEFSQRTKIPLIGGTFKAALGEIILTAVTSEFVGSRFVVQKKNPFQQLI